MATDFDAAAMAASSAGSKPVEPMTSAGPPRAAQACASSTEAAGRGEVDDDIGKRQRLVALDQAITGAARPVKAGDKRQPGIGLDGQRPSAGPCGRARRLWLSSMDAAWRLSLEMLYRTIVWHAALPD